MWQPQIAKKITENPYFGGSTSRSFKVIDVGTTGKLVSSACYDTQQVCVSICNRSVVRLVDSIAETVRFEGGIPKFDTLVRRTP